MKQKIYIFLYLMLTAVNSVAQTSYTITNIGLQFNPDTLYVEEGDTINFVLSSTHNAVEVDQSTFLANGNTSNGGFNLPLGGGSWIADSAQTYYYVCTPHAAIGMTGVIISSCNKNIIQATTGFNPNAVYGATTLSYDTLTFTNTSSCDIRVRPEFTISKDIGAISQGDIILKMWNPLSNVFATLPYSIDGNGNAVGSLGIPFGDTTGVIISPGTLTTIVRVKFTPGNWGNYCANWETKEVDSLGNVIQNLTSATTTCIDFIDCSNLSATASVTGVTCNGYSDGSATVTVLNGTPPYSYLWYTSGIPLQTSQTITGLPIGTYDCVVTDTNGCQATNSVSITQPNYFSVDFTTSFNDICEGDAVTLNFDFNQGGVAPYTINYTENGISQTTSVANSGLYNISVSPLVGANTYNVTSITDASGCINQNTINQQNINVFELPSATLSTTPSVNCDGTATVIPSGGCAPYTYLWDNGQVSDSINSLCADSTYCVSVTDCNGCVISECGTINAAGCTDSTACNYDSNATVDDGSCTYTTTSDTTVTACDNYTWYDSTYTASGVYTHISVGNGSSSPPSGTVSLLSYCASNPNSNFAGQAQTIIENVELVGDNIDINNNTAGTNDFYEDYTPTIYADLSEGNSYTVNVTADDLSSSVSYAPEAINVYIDFNIDGDFLDAGEDLGVVNIPAGTWNPGTVYPFNVTVPATGIYGPTRMRVVCLSNSGVGGVTMGPCESPTGFDPPWFGATEDYSIVLSAPTAGGCDTLATLYLTINNSNNSTSSVTECNGYVWEGQLYTTTGVYTDTLTNISGCDSIATLDLTINNCTVLGCTDPTASNYDPTASIDDGSCIYCDSLINNTTTISSNVNCYGGNDGSALVNAVGGALPYTYIWSNGDTTATNTGLSAGFYTCIVTDITGCSVTVSANISEPAEVLVGLVVSNATCFGNYDGYASVTPSGVTAGNYDVLFNGINYGSNFFGPVPSGNYNVEVINTITGCSSGVISFNISQPNALSAPTPTSSPVSCLGGNNGSATMNPIGGTPPYSYLWSDSQTTQQAINLLAGFYTCEITDNNGCIFTTNITITQPLSALTTSNSTTPISCYGYTDGSVSINVSGGDPSYSINFNNFTITNDSLTIPTGIPAGVYAYSVTDSNNCTIYDTVTLTQPDSLSLLLSTDTICCFGNNDGVAIADISGGTAPYTFLWDDPSLQITQNATNLSAGTYSVQIVDDNNCTLIDSINVYENSILSISLSTTDPLCFGDATGSIFTNTIGGDGNYTYIWNNGDTTANISNLVAGIYSVTVIDGCGCTETIYDTIIEPTQISLSIDSLTHITSYGGNNGAIYVSINGGSGPLNTSWTSNNGISSNNEDINFLLAGNYYLEISDTNNCTHIDTIVLTQPNSLSLDTFTSTNSTCFNSCNGALSIDISGGLGIYNYSWLGPNGFIGSGDTITGLCEGLYTVIISDGVTTLTETFNIFEPQDLYANLNLDTIACHNGEALAEILVLGGTQPYSYDWSNGDSIYWTMLNAGSHSVTVTDQNGCSFSQSFSLSDPDTVISTADFINTVSCHGGNDGSACIISTNGGTPPYTFEWFNTANVSIGQGDTAINLFYGTYSCIITDINGCLGTADVFINQATEISSDIITTPPSCYDTCDGSILVTNTTGGGWLTYNYVWLDGNSDTINNTGLLDNICAGVYNLLTIDNLGCIQDTTIVLTEPNPLLATVWIDSISLVATSGFSSYQWYSGNGMPITGATNTSFIPTSMGEYYVVVTDGNCGGISDTVNYIINALDDFNQKIRIYPNPTSGLLTINGINKISKVSIIDGLGNQLLKVENNNNEPGARTLDLSSFAKGIYFIQIEQNEQIINYRIVLQ